MLTRSSTRKLYTMEISSTTVENPGRGESKKRKIGRQEEGVTELPIDVFSMILPFLEAPAMLNVASTNKEIAALVTHKLVIRNTLITSNGKTGRRVKHILHRLSLKSSIYLPSPMRLLRLLHGHQCECRGCNLPVPHLTAGLLLCHECAKEKTSPYSLSRSGFVKKFQSLFSIEDFSLFHDKLLTKKPFRSIDGQRNGTLFSKAEVDRMLREDISVEEYIDNNDVPVPTDKYVDQLIEVAMAADSERNNRFEEIRNRKSDGIVAIEGAIASLQSNLRGVATDFALDYEIRNRHGSWTIKMTYPLSSHILRGFVLHERYATQKRLLELPIEISSAYNDIAASGIVDFTCFSNDSQNHGLEASIRIYLQRTIEPGEGVLRSHMLSQYVLKLIRRGDVRSAMLSFAFGQYHGHIPYKLLSIIVDLIVSQTNLIGDAIRSKMFARRIATICIGADAPKPGAWSHLEYAYRLSSWTYCRLAPLIEEYHNDTQTAAFCASRSLAVVVDVDYDSGKLVDMWVKNKGCAVQAIWCHMKDYPEVLEFLLAKDWTGLRNYHAEAAMKKLRRSFPVLAILEASKGWVVFSYSRCSR